MILNKILKILFIISTAIFLMLFVSLPKTDCEACSFEYNGETIDGAKAFEIFEDACISYRKPWQTGIEDINITFIEEDSQYDYEI